MYGGDQALEVKLRVCRLTLWISSMLALCASTFVGSRSPVTIRAGLLECEETDGGQCMALFVLSLEEALLLCLVQMLKGVLSLFPKKLVSKKHSVSTEVFLTHLFLQTLLVDSASVLGRWG